VNELEANRPNIIVIVIDTLRLDKSAPIAKALDGAIDYGWAVTPAPWTLPAHVSLLTGLYPSIHESHERLEMKSLVDFVKLRNNKATLMTKLKKLGYTTYGYSANSFISRAFGFEGFDVLKNWEVSWAELLFEMDAVSVYKFAKFLHTRHLRDFISPLARVLRRNPRLFLSTLYASIDAGIDRAFHSWPKNKGLRNVLDFVNRTKFKEPFFLFLNILEVHEPYFKKDHLIEGGFAVQPTSSIDKELLDLWTKGYETQVEQVAEKLPELTRILKEKGLFDNTLIILTSDHGQLLGEHGWIGHGVFLYDELVKVPLLIKYPSNPKIDLSQRKGFISLANVPNFIIDLVEGRNTDSSLFSAQAFSESWFYLPKTPGRVVCVYSEEGKVTYNFLTEKVEEANVNRNSSNDAVIDNLVRKCRSFADLNERLGEITALEEK